MKESPKIQKLEGELTRVRANMSKQAKGFRDSTFTRFPIIFSLLTTFGLVATLYGFEKVIDKIDLLNTHPEILLVVGLLTLAGTGSLYKKLS